MVSKQIPLSRDIHVCDLVWYLEYGLHVCCVRIRPEWVFLLSGSAGTCIVLRHP